MDDLQRNEGLLERGGLRNQQALCTRRLLHFYLQRGVWWKDIHNQSFLTHAPFQSPYPWPPDSIGQTSLLSMLELAVSMQPGRASVDREAISKIAPPRQVLPGLPEAQSLTLGSRDLPRAERRH